MNTTIEKYGKKLIVSEIDNRTCIKVDGQKTPYAKSDYAGTFFLYDRSISNHINCVKSLGTSDINEAIDGMYRWGNLKEETYRPMDCDIEPY